MQYRHPKLGWIAEQTGESYQGKDLYSIYQVVGGSVVKQASRYSYSEEELTALGFEPVEERDWIDDVIQEMKEAHKYVSWDEYRKIIEKHAPQTKKFTREDVENYYMEATCKTRYSVDSIDFIVEFLKDHNLLSETD